MGRSHGGIQLLVLRMDLWFRHCKGEKMELGETLQILEGIIYEKAKRELETAETPLSLQTVVMDAVAAKFKEEAYENLRISTMQKETQTEARTGTPEELLKELNEGEGAKK